MKNLLQIVYFLGIFAYIKADCGITLDRANLQEDDIPGNIYLNLTDSRIESKYSYSYRKPSGKLRRHTPSFGCILVVWLEKYFFFRNKTFLFFKIES